MRTVNGCILLLAAISITFAAVSGAYHLDMQQLLALILRQENVPVQEQIVFWQIRVPRILAARCFWARRWQGPEPPIRECSVIP